MIIVLRQWRHFTSLRHSKCSKWSYFCQSCSGIRVRDGLRFSSTSRMSWLIQTPCFLLAQFEVML